MGGYRRYRKPHSKPQYRPAAQKARAAPTSETTALGALWGHDTGVHGGSQAKISWAAVLVKICMIAVGTLIAERPPHGPVRAQFGHTVLTLGD
jgi:hypothetical protein